MTALWVVIAIVAIAGTCNSQTCLFDVPPPAGPTKDYSNNPTYTVGTVQQLTWRMDVDSAQLLLWQDNHPGDPIGGDHVIVTENTNAEAFHWTVSYEGLDPTINNVFYFQVVASDCTFTSHYFNLTGIESSTSSSTSPVSTATPTFSGPTSGSSTTGTSASSTSTSINSATITSPIPTPSSGGAAVSSNNINIGLVAGLSVVGSLIFIIAVLGAGYLLRRWYRRRKLEKQKSIEHGGQDQVASQRRKGSILVGEMQEIGDGEEARELEVVEPRVELDHLGRMVHYELQ